MNSYYYNNYRITELSYFEYKNLAKNLFTEDLDTINKVFEDILQSQVNVKYLSIENKFKCLIFLRSLTLGEEFNLSYKEKNYNFNVNNILENIFLNEEDYDTESIDLTKSNKFYINDTLNELINNIKGITLKNKYYDFTEFAKEQKKELLDNITDINIVDVSNKMLGDISNNYLKILDLKLNLHNGDILTFLKNIFYSDLNNLYDLEYFLIKNLNLNTNDFKNYSLSELKILMNKVIEEYKESNKNDNTGIPLSR